MEVPVAQRIRLVTTLMAAAALVAACSSGSTAPTAGKAAVTTLRVGFVPVVETAPLYLANQQGFFAQEHLHVVLDPLSNAASIVPSILNGQLQIGAAATVPFIEAVSKGVPIKAIATAGNRGSRESAIVVNPASGIRSPRDLSGKTVAVNQLKAIFQLVTMAAVQKDGGDPTSVKFIDLPFTDALSAVKTGRVDAATVVEPFVTIAAHEGLDVISAPYDVLPANSNIAVAFSSNAYLTSHGAVLARFVSALNRATAYAASHPSQVRAVMPKYTTMSPTLAGEIHLPAYAPGLTASSIEPTLALMLRYGFLARSPSPSQLIASP
ncbi:MAG: ABC transporter substrate-binding protein [Acidimicrobiales bacterium]